MPCTEKCHLDNNLALEKLLPFIKGNISLMFTKNDLIEVRDKIANNKVAAPAKAGAIAPLDVILQSQNTRLGPKKTSFFPALAIPTKKPLKLSIVNLIKEGDKV